MDTEFFKTYGNITGFLVYIKSRWTLTYLFWLAHHADKTNMFNTGKVQYEEFIEYLRICGMRDFELPVKRTIASCIKELSQSNLIIQVRRGEYMLNPSVFWKSSEKEKQKVISVMKEHFYLGPGRKGKFYELNK